MVLGPFEISTNLVLDPLCKGGENIGEGSNHGSIVFGGHSTNKDGIEVISVCN